MKVLYAGIWRDFDEEKRCYASRERAIRLAAMAHKRNDLARIMARHEIESDEFKTAEQKALALWRRGER